MESTHLGDLRIQTVLDSGFFLHQKQRDPKTHNHLNHELYFVENGTCTAACNDIVYPCKTGDLLLIPIGTDHSVLQLSADASLYSLRFSCHPTAEASSLSGNIHTLLEQPLQFHSLQLLSILQGLRWELAHLLPLSTEKFQGLLQTFYAEFLRHLLTSTPAPASCETSSIVFPQASKLPGYQQGIPQEYYIDMLDEFFTHPPIETPTLTELANRLHLSVSQTKRLIKSQYGISFQQKLANARIEHSKYLMRTTPLSLEQIAEQVGYHSYNTFFEAFFAQTGETPSQYRKSL